LLIKQTHKWMVFAPCFSLFSQSSNCYARHFMFNSNLDFICKNWNYGNIWNINSILQQKTSYLKKYLIIGLVCFTKVFTLAICC
jgi:hypothetical protein